MYSFSILCWYSSGFTAGADGTGLNNVFRSKEGLSVFSAASQPTSVAMRLTRQYQKFFRCIPSRLDSMFSLSPRPPSSALMKARTSNS